MAAGCTLAAPEDGGSIALFESALRGVAAEWLDAATPEDISRLGPYADAQATNYHFWKQSAFQRDAALCGTCHDVSNPITGDLAPAHGRLAGALPPGAFSGVPNGRHRIRSPTSRRAGATRWAPCP